MRVPVRHGALRCAVVAILALAVGMITGLEMVTAAGAEGHRSSTEPAAARLSGDDVDGPEAVGVKPAPGPTVGRAANVARMRSVVLAAAVLATGVASLGTAPGHSGG